MPLWACNVRFPSNRVYMCLGRNLNPSEKGSRRLPSCRVGTRYSLISSFFKTCRDGRGVRERNKLVPPFFTVLTYFRLCCLGPFASNIYVSILFFGKGDPAQHLKWPPRSRCVNTTPSSRPLAGQQELPACIFLIILLYAYKTRRKQSKRKTVCSERETAWNKH